MLMSSVLFGRVSFGFYFHAVSEVECQILSFDAASLGS